ncbi:hypothetical protein CLIB1423_12S01772 [[Candida] railenensis]|uniref:Ubiquitin-like protease family profile domain-containing protein n=1 Tax=[Candida] railenensis TaxID=45579 RepID=A0A9P0QST5_9ASCO|nr:hypothetical protein CLIB1423_12S01772 [[Candida] railenensis]
MDLNNPIFFKERGNSFQRSGFRTENRRKTRKTSSSTVEDSPVGETHQTVTGSSYNHIMFEKVTILLTQLLVLISSVASFGKKIYQERFVGENTVAIESGGSGTYTANTKKGKEAGAKVSAEKHSNSAKYVTNPVDDERMSTKLYNDSPSLDLISILCPDLNASDSEESESDGKQYGTRIKLVRKRRTTEVITNESIVEDILSQQPKTPSPRSSLTTSSVDSSIVFDTSSIYPSTPSKRSAQLQPQQQPQSPVQSPNSYDAAVARYYLPSIPPKHHSLVDSLLSSFKPTENWLFDLKRKQELITKERISSTSLIEPLTVEQLAKIKKVWNSSNLSIVVSSAFQIDITCRDLQTLCDGSWLNDNVIDFYSSLITNDKPSVFCWTTHFFTTLQSKGYTGVARWAKRKKLDVTQMELVLVPINIMGTHWALAAVDNKLKEFQYYDSLSSSGNLKALQILKTYMQEEGKRLNSSIDFNEYKLVPLMDSPQQSNGYDCGVFTCTSAFFVSGRKPLNFSQKDMKLLRRKMAYEILTKELL